MLKNITLEKPLAVIDLETTGTDTQKDRIVEISVLKLFPNGKRVHHTRRLNPGVPIPPEATAIHNITDEDVADELRFEQIADALLRFLDGCDLCGFNLKKFDLRMLCCEFARAGRQLSLEGRAILDPMQIYHRHEPRDLGAAVRFYLNREHGSGHSAAADVLATAELLDAMVAHYSVLPRSVAALHQHFTDVDQLGSDGFFRKVGGEIRFVKGKKHRGEPLDIVAANDPAYLEWMLAQDFFEDTKAIVRRALTSARATVQAANDTSSSFTAASV
jgi:DNA polymerase-3 subunit epsilon